MRLPNRLHRLVGAVVVLGVLLDAGVLYAFPHTAPVASLGPLRSVLSSAHQGRLLVLLLALTFAGDLVAVRVRRGGQTEELTLFEAAVVVDVLLLPTPQSVLVPVVASLLCSLVRRRGGVKAVFNAGNLAAATAVLVATVELVSGPGQGLSARTVAGLLLGTLLFTTVNLLALSHVLAVVDPALSPWRLANDGARLSALMAAGTVALGGGVVAVAGTAPALLPFTLMPAVALTFAYRAAAQESEERERSSRLLALSQVLAGRLRTEDLLAAFVSLTREAFGADVALAVLDPEGQPSGSSPRAVVDDRHEGTTHRPATGTEHLLLVRAATAGAGVATEALPDGWARALLAPLEADGRRLGVLVLAVRDRRRPLHRRELSLLTPLSSALAVALRGAAHLQQVTEETGKLQAVVDASSDGILVLDGTGTVALWSPAMVQLTGREAISALGRPLSGLITTRGVDGEPADAFLVGRRELEADRPQHTVELTLLRPDGEERMIRCAHAGVFDGDRLVRDVVIVHDVTRERQVERLKADFIATVSHELRTPVTPIKGYADLLRRRGDQLSPQKRVECLDVISDRAAHLARLVEDLLLASRISATEGSAPAHVEMASADLGALTRRACADFGADTHDGARIILDVPDEPVVVGCDPVRVVQVLSNLVSNAVKYSPAGSPIDVRLAAGDGVATVEVEDRGRGIPEDQLEKVFDKFHRVEDSMRMTTGGTGLGLYIARQLAAAMSATLTCRSVLGSGSVFTFTLPHPPAARLELPGERQSEGAATGPGLR